jgi:cysteine desulfurase/selenocysteine lyase
VSGIGSLRDEFGDFDGRVWLNAAHQGPLPLRAADAARRAIADKLAPHRIADEDFRHVPEELRSALARTIGALPDDVILGNSTTYGLHLLAHGLPLRDGDEVLLVDGDFPATVVPWLRLRERGVRVRLLEPRARPLPPEQLEAELGPRTRVFCSSWVFSLSGETVDLAEFGRVCREREVVFVVNGSQGVGARPLDVAAAPADALVSCGFKWLCGPYATGFCWIRPDVRDTLEYRQDYWLAQLTGDDLSSEAAYALRDDLGARRFDVFGTANFLDFAPWRAAVELLLEVGLERIAAHDDALVQLLVDGLAAIPRLRLASPADQPARSALVLASHVDEDRTDGLHAALAAGGVDVALRGGLLRLSPHLYNTSEDVERALALLARHA